MNGESPKFVAKLPKEVVSILSIWKNMGRKRRGVEIVRPEFKKETGVIGFVKRWYYRYSVLTGIYVCTMFECCIIHSILLLGLLAFGRYIVIFLIQMSSLSDHISH